MRAKYYTVPFDARKFPTLAAAKVAVRLAGDKKRYNNTMIIGIGVRGERISFVHVQAADYFIHFKKTYKYEDL